jgi:hypothetical protein
MPSLDVFSESVFDVTSLSNAIDYLPFQPSRLGELGLFVDKPVTTLTVMVESRDNTLQIFKTAARGTMPYTMAPKDRRVRPFRVPHIPVLDAILADDVQGVRSFGSEDELETVQELVNDKMEAMKQNMEVTREWHRVGCLKGEVLDGDGTSVIYNYFTEFGVTQTEIEVDFHDNGTYDQADPNEDMKMVALAIKRAMDGAMGGTAYRGIHVICGDVFFERLIAHATVRRAFEKFTDGSPYLREQQMKVNGAYLGFEFGGITWENYRGSIGGTKFIEDDEAHAFPIGAGDLFQQVLAPADFVETVNTRGKAMYVKQERMKFDKGIELYGQSNPLHMCVRPKSLIKLVDVTAVSMVMPMMQEPEFDDPNDRAAYRQTMRQLFKLQMREDPKESLNKRLHELASRAESSPTKGVAPQHKAEFKTLLKRKEELQKLEPRDQERAERRDAALEQIESRMQQLREAGEESEAAPLTE